MIWLFFIDKQLALYEFNKCLHKVMIDPPSIAPQGGFSKRAAERFERTIGRRCNIAVSRQSEDGLSEGYGLIVEGVNIVISHMDSSLIQSSWDLLVNGSPEIIASNCSFIKQQLPSFDHLS